MTDNTQNNQHADPRKQERLKWQAAVAIPAYGVLRIDTVTNDLFSAVKPDGASGLYYVNDHVAVPINGYGSSLEWVRAQPVMFEPGASVAVGAACGPVDGQWYMSGDGTGWLVFIPPNGDDIAFVVKDGGSGGGGVWVRGVSSNPDCDLGTMDVTAVAFSGGCDEIPGAYGNLIEDVTDPYTIMSVYSETPDELDGAIVRIEYMYPVDDCTNGVWELTIVVATSGC